MSEFFRVCPACGRRFHIKLVDRKLVDDRKERTEIKQAMVTPPALVGKMVMGSLPVVVEENVPITVEIRDFQYSYKCKHCGHTWMEMRETEKKSERD